MVGLEERIEALENQGSQVAVGIVNSVQEKDCTVRVKLPDRDGVITSPLQVLVKRSLGNLDYDMPEKGEEVLCLFLTSGFEIGFVIGSLYSEVDPPPVTDANKKHYKFKDGTSFEYDRKISKLTIDIKGAADIGATGDINIKSGSHITMTAPRIDLN
ncbi:MAG: phage baseplate assembly protein V [Desulfotalea sp.]